MQQCEARSVGNVGKGGKVGGLRDKHDRSRRPFWIEYLHLGLRFSVCFFPLLVGSTSNGAHLGPQRVRELTWAEPVIKAGYWSIDISTQRDTLPCGTTPPMTPSIPSIPPECASCSRGTPATNLTRVVSEQTGEPCEIHARLRRRQEDAEHAWDAGADQYQCGGSIRCNIIEATGGRIHVDQTSC